MTRGSLLVFSCLTIILSACEPERGIRAVQEEDSQVDIACIDLALRQEFGSVERWDYVSDGGTFPRGTAVAQFAFFKWNEGVGWGTLHTGTVGRKTRISQEFTGVGAALPQASFPPALEAMARARASIATRCSVSLNGAGWNEIGQNVDALP
jgi:hypothetical protein